MATPNETFDLPTRIEQAKAWLQEHDNETNRLRTVTVHRQILGGEQPPACQDAALLIKSRCGLAQSSINLTAAEYRSY